MRKRLAFTLVELLVVIGIIALLISILLPALSRARGAANSIDCQARLRQIGMGMQVYASQNNGVFPWGALDHDAGYLSAFPNPYVNERWWKWHYTISQMLGTESMAKSTDWWGGNNPVMIDKDTIEGQPWGWRVDYIANPRIMPNNSGSDNTPFHQWNEGKAPDVKPTLMQRKVASIRNASEVMAVWDAPQWSDYGNSSPETAQHAGGWQFYWGTYMVTPNPKPSDTWVDGMYNQTIRPGAADGDGAVLQKQWNKDFGGAPWAPANAGEDWASAFRFRHINNTTLNAVFADGHCESRKVGEVKYKDIASSIY
jgi:prepilin-type N-terminal cleavage/methylation domain-containing protein/prepilin-type processing-associated H-X9-DG protein